MAGDLVELLGGVLGVDGGDGDAGDARREQVVELATLLGRGRLAGDDDLHGEVRMFALRLHDAGAGDGPEVG